jgi:two-component system cell cycle sensor histidine kinase/response regulator CckA
MDADQPSPAIQIPDLTLQEILDSVQDVFYQVDQDGRLVMFSRSGAAELGYDDVGQLLGRKVSELWYLPERRREMVDALDRNGVLNDWEAQLRRRDGSPVTVATTIRLVFDAEGRKLGYRGIWRNIEQRKRAEEALRQSEEKFSKIFQTVPDTIVVTRARDGLLLDVNPGFEQATGWSRAESVGRTTPELSLWADLAARDRMVATLRQKGEVLNSDFIFRRKNGEERPGVFSARSLTLGGEACLLFLRRDVTEQKRLEAEAALLEAQLLQSQKLDAVGQVAGGVAHDFNNLLTVQLGNLGLLAEVEGLPQEARELLVEIEQSARAAAGLTRQLLAFSRRQVLQARRVELNQVLSGFLGMLRRVLREDIQLEVRPSGCALWVEADVGMLEQVFMNLVVNARDAMPGGGHLTLSCESVEVVTPPAAAAEARRGRYARLTVADDGQGMDEATQRRIFEPFFTTKPTGKGSGLGLATVYGIVKQHGGWIEVESAPGRGSRFRVHWPEQAGDEGGAADVASDAPLGHGETVLLVEDDHAVRRTLRGLLTRLNYRPLEALNGVAAEALWRAEKGSIDILVTDMVMPGGVSGLELVHRLRAEEPGLPAIVLSGYSADLVQGGVPGDVAFLSKPCDPADLARVLRDQLRRRAPRPG